MKLNCKSKYRNGAAGLSYNAGKIDVSDEIGTFLLRDAPENFEVIEEKAAKGKAADAPARDKAVKAAPRKKAAKKG